MDARKLMLAACMVAAAVADGPGATPPADDFDDFNNSAASEFDAFMSGADKELQDFLAEANQEMADFLGKPWLEMLALPGLTPEPDPEPAPIVIDNNRRDRVKPGPKPVVVDTIITPPAPRPVPTPVSPIRELPVRKHLPDIRCKLYGTIFGVRGVDLKGFAISGRDYAGAWKRLLKAKVNNFVIDCLELREEHCLCDWAFMKMVQAFAGKLAGGRHNEASMLTGYLLSQCGYKMRFCCDGTGNLHVLYACDGIVYNTYSLEIDGSKFYALTELSGRQLSVCNFSFPREQSVSMAITRGMNLAFAPSPVRTITAKFCPELTVSVTLNRNLIDFYNGYPEATLDRSSYTRWAIYANVPVSEELRRDLYPKARKAIAGKSQKDAANILLHLAQTFPYGYDSEIWGRDRAFFPDETWYYPYSDCEDHAIHFSRLVRDLMGLDVVLVYYPGHLASAVAFTDDSVTGDYVMHRGRRFTVCDPTIFYSEVGETMSGMDNSSAVLIDLSR